MAHGRWYLGVAALALQKMSLLECTKISIVLRFNKGYLTSDPVNSASPNVQQTSLEVAVAWKLVLLDKHID
jgi:hypothetical protein